MRTVLVVDEQPAVCLALEVLLELHGWQVLTATSAATALDLLATTRVDVVIQELKLEASDAQGASGWKLLQELRVLWPKLPVVVLTSLSSSELRDRCLIAGAWSFLAKPWDNERLIDSLDRLLRSGWIRSEPAVGVEKV